MKRPRLASKAENGFTIIELMIAASVLAVILLMVTVIMINIGNLYYKGVTQARVQDDVRSISDDLAKQLELDDAALVPGSTVVYTNHGQNVNVSSYCVGSVRYSYVVGIQMGSGFDTDALPTHQINHVLWRDVDIKGDCEPLDLTASDPTAAAPTLSQPGSGSELAAPGSRLAYFTITSTSGISPYTISLELAYGNYDLLTATTGSPTNLVNCKVGTGDRFCATSNLTTTVASRL